jgi:hypothetical protein
LDNPSGQFSIMRYLNNGAIKASTYWDNTATKLENAISSTGNFTWVSNGSEWMRIGTTGNVGIGTTTPIAKLDVYTSDVNGIRSISTTALGSTSGGGFFAQNNASSTAADQRLGGLFFGTNIDGTSYSNAGITGYSSEAWTPTARGSHLRFETAGLGASSRTERMRITADGNVGIGSTTPNGKLVVWGTNDQTLGLQIGNSGQGGNPWYIGREGATTGRLAIGNGSTEAVSVVTSGNVGIGSTTPSRKLSVEGTLGSTPIFEIGSLGTSQTLSMGNWYGGTAANSWISAGGSPLLLNPAGGNVGIGTTTSGAITANGFSGARSLSIAGTYAGLYLRRSSDDLVGLDLTADTQTTGAAYIDSRYTVAGGGFYFRTQTAGTPVNALRIDTAGNIGIGTTSSGLRCEQPSERIRPTNSLPVSNALCIMGLERLGNSAFTRAMKSVGYFFRLVLATVNLLL